MKASIEITIANANPEFMALVLTPVVNAVWILIVGVISSFLISLWRAYTIKQKAVNVYSTHTTVLKELQESLDSLILWEKNIDDGKKTYTLPEIDFGGSLSGSINLLPKWLPFSAYKAETYYLLYNLKEYNKLKQPQRTLTEDVATEYQIKVFSNALNLACNVYIKLLYLSDKSKYEKDNIAIEALRNTDFALKYYNCASQSTGRFFKLIRERNLKNKQVEGSYSEAQETQGI